MNSVSDINIFTTEKKYLALYPHNYKLKIVDDHKNEDGTEPNFVAQVHIDPTTKSNYLSTILEYDFKDITSKKFVS